MNNNNFHYGHRLFRFREAGHVNSGLHQKKHVMIILKRIGSIYVHTLQMHDKTVVYMSAIQDWCADEFREMENHLPAYRVEKAAQFLKKEDKQTSLLASWMLECLIGFSSIAYTAYGKPYVLDRRMYCSVAHSDGVVAVALSNEEVGVDCEKCQLPAQPSIMSLFHANEVWNLTKGYESFASIWTSKEAYGKWLGVGLNYELHVMNVKEQAVFWKEEKLPLTMKKLVYEQCMIAVCARHAKWAQCIDFKGSVRHASEFSRRSSRE